MKTRLLDDQIQKVVAALRDTSDEMGFVVQRVLGARIVDVDDTSWQTLETLVFWCDGCDSWDLIENLGSGGQYCETCDTCWNSAPTTTPEEVYGLQELLMCEGNPIMNGEYCHTTIS